MRKLIPSLLLAAVIGSVPAIQADASELPDGALSTRGSQIVDRDDHPVRIVSIGAWTDVSAQMGLIRSAGFNTIRMDWGNRELGPAKFQMLDHVIANAALHHLKVILDDHSNETGVPGPWKPCSAQQVNGLWYDRGGASDNTDGCHTSGTVTDAKFIADWKSVAQHYRGNSTVIGYDLWNEPAAYPGMSTWESGGRNPDHNIRFMCERAGNAILFIDPQKLIICEGPMNAKTSFANTTSPAPWGDLSLAGKYPVTLSVDHRLVYSVHDYPAAVGGYRPDSGATKVQQMNSAWGYLVRDHITPVWIGETGADMKNGTERQWFHTLRDYLNGKLGDQGGPVFTPPERGIGIDWWFAGYDPYGTPHGIFDALGKLNVEQWDAYRQFD